MLQDSVTHFRLNLLFSATFSTEFTKFRQCLPNGFGNNMCDLLMILRTMNVADYD